MAKNETVTVVEEFEYAEDGFLLKKTTTTTTRENPVYDPYRWGSGPRPHFVVSSEQGSYLNGTR